jgi:asparagine synthase (glutamine-hydrolysing)
MCGIAGFVGAVSGNAHAPLGTLAHRGPDDSGWTTHAAHAAGSPHSVLLHRRLSILDLSDAGHQPMASIDGRFAIVFNGEIYNYRELRDELTRAGCVFRTQSDTEVLLQAYIQWGSACLQRLIGMFAFAVRDEQRRMLFLARDFFGMKPLYYVMPEGRGFAFASEIKALLDWLPIERAVHPQRLYDYLRWDCTDHGNDTLWRDIRQLPAAHYLEVPLDSPATRTPTRYWNLPSNETLDLSFDEAARQLREMFLHNIRLHLRSDVPVGAALSGGIDSSAVVAAMRVVAPSAEIHAFSYIADDAALSEERWIDLVGSHVSAIVHKIHPQPDDLIADLDHLINTQDEPFGSTSIYAQYCVFRAAREHGIKVMLDGQGADEMLAGYRRYVPARLGALLATGRWLQAWRLARHAGQTPGGTAQLRLWLQAGRLLLPAAGKRMINRWLMPTWLNIDWFAKHGVELDPGRHALELREELKQTVAVSSLPQLLRYEDRNSMASSIESRLPFLTPQLAEFLLRLPDDYLLGPDGTTKRVFRQAMRGIVPDAILDRRDKIGFATPEKRWLQSLHPWVEATLSSERARSIGVLNLPAIQRELAAVRAGLAKFDFRIWRWVNLIRWAERFDVRFD